MPKMQEQNVKLDTFGTRMVEKSGITNALIVERYFFLIFKPRTS